LTSAETRIRLLLKRTPVICIQPMRTRCTVWYD